MEVIRHGNRYAVTICPECDCEFRFAKTEILTQTMPEYSGYYAQIDYIECPECGHRVTLEDRAIEV